MKILETTSFTKWLYTCGHTNSQKKKAKIIHLNLQSKQSSKVPDNTQVTSSNSLDFY